VYYSDSWHDIFSGSITARTWAEKTLPLAQTITAVRIKSNTDTYTTNLLELEISEVTLTTVASVTATGVSSGEHKVVVGADGTDFWISVDDAVAPAAGYDEVAIGGSSVPDNANDWIIGQNNVLPYLDYYTHTVGGSLVTKYQPITIIANTGEAGTADAGSTTTLDDAVLTQANDYWNHARLHIVTTTDGNAPKGETSVVTDFDAATDRLTFGELTVAVGAGDTYTVDFGTLPDREAAANDAIITWGYNPSGVDATLGSMTSSGQPALWVSSEEATSDLLPTAGGTDWDTAPAVTGALLTNPMRPIIVAISDNTTFSERQVWVWLGVILVIFVMALTSRAVRGHYLITGVAAGAVIVFLVVQTIFPIWALVFVILAILGGLVSERSHSL